MMSVAGLAEAAQSLRDMEADVHHPPPELATGEEGASRPAKMARAGSGAARSTLRHIETEQRRRDRINEGFKALRELLPTTEKMDKANFLMACVAYIRQLQAVMQQLLAMGAVSKLPEEVQWNVRVLLPRKEEPAAAAAKAAQAVAGPAVVQFPGLHMPFLAQQGQGDAAQIQNLLLAQQLQQQQQQQSATSMQNQIMQAQQLLQLNQLLQSAQQDVSGNNLVAQLAQQNPTMLATLGMLLPNLAAANPGNSQPIQAAPVQASAPAGGCGAGPAAALEAGHIIGGGNGAAPKARKTTKVRRHTTAARLSKPPSPSEELASVTPDGRPLQGEIGS
ncbi:probable transcription factor PIF3 at N-terminal half [Coccomyxa sp. Obi]|nr:probable transcription factor PIF3 at N-terminal half [Coccomyxa sp. Obi]